MMKFWRILKIHVRLLIFIFIGLIFSSAVQSAERFSLLGLTFPTMKIDRPDTALVLAPWDKGGVGAESWLAEGDYLPEIGFPLQEDLLFYLDSTGESDSITYSSPKDSNYLKQIVNSLKGIRFEPAEYEDSAISFILPVRIVLSRRLNRPYATLHFPYTPVGDNRDRFLLENALTLNGFTAPSLRSFPAYYCAFKKGQKADLYPFAVFHLMIDSSGKVVRILEHCTSNESYTDVVSRALLYADFSPAAYRGKTMPSEMFLTFRFFERLRYPTSTWPPDSSTIPDLPFDYIRIDPSLYLDSLTNPPIPFNFPYGEFRTGGKIPHLITMEAFVTIDTLGNIIFSAFDRPSWDEPVKLAAQLLRALKFLPARNLNEYKVLFTGRMRIEFDNSENIRIFVSWLPLEAQKARRVNN
jgi:hypothetical protein